MCPDILYLFPSGGMNKEYRPIRHVYSLDRKLSTGGPGDCPLKSSIVDQQDSASSFYLSLTRTL